MSRLSRFARPALAAAAVLAGGAVSAQPMWRTTPTGPSVSFDVLRSFEGRSVVTDEFGREVGDAGPTALNTAQVLSARVPVGSRFVLVADLPTAYFDYGVSEGTPDPVFESEFALGNPYLGVEVAALRALTVEAGVRVPVASSGDGFSQGRFTGLQASFETLEMYQDGTFSARLGVRYEPTVTESVRFRFLAAPVVRSFDGFVEEDFMIREARQTSLDVQYGAQIIGQIDRVELLGGVVGRVATADNEPFDPASLTFGASARGLPVRPGLLVRVPVHDDLLGTDAVVGLSLDVPLR